ncbi:arginine--tRNA ligase [Mycoplasmopsis columbinasalis]|uniref:Arginine--tRNA ligase n=1 Tax=Mycoplasmopsis columbinasalis TaxID=114880 RepID=A0A449BAX2_9BACT|nr:arginine--tRNA ligase [Mycoplasmopsis columbinasalis]VEU78347.1 Arginyl-tRNA synthetase [Mycoplasmopsis columbinasalis]
MNKVAVKEKILIELKQIAHELGLEKEVIFTEPKSYADFATSLAMGNKGRNPQEVAKEIIAKLEPKKAELFIGKIEVAGPGFLNFFLSENSLVQGLSEVLKLGSNYGRGNKSGKINVEFVSANPTGFLHIGHARNAAIGSTLANILEFSGMTVEREYYINDAGNQINMLANSVFARYQQLFDQNFPMPEEAYHGEDIIWAAEEFHKKYGDKFKGATLTPDVLKIFKDDSLSLFLAEIERDLKRFGVWFDTWYSERSLYNDDSKIIKEAIKKLNNVYEKDGATWLRTTASGDDKDRVLIKSNGEYTYFTPDIAYHNIKFNKTGGQDGIVMDVWGGDHSGYVKRMQIAMENLGHKPENLIILCMQLVRLMKNGEEFKMSKRRGTTFFLREFLDLVGKDSARFILLDRTFNSKLDFDIEIATSKTNDNPAVLVQYANARAKTLLSKSNYKLEELIPEKYDLQTDEKLINTILEFPEVVQKSADKYLTNMLTQYLIKLAKEFNSWYSNTDKIIGNENEKSLLALVRAVNITIENGMKLIGIEILENM